MREIKFRAWTEPENKMFSWNNLLNMNLHNALTIPEQCGLILMQYTGLKDKNGKEIYEGDIVKIDNNVKAIKAQVEYSETFAQYIITHTGDIVSEAEPLGDYDEIIEVIGNIYDNPELMKEE